MLHFLRVIKRYFRMSDFKLKKLIKENKLLQNKLAEKYKIIVNKLGR